MTDAANRSATCEGKQAFDSFERAEAVRKRHRRDRHALAVYHCPVCHWFHIGTPKRINFKGQGDV